MRFDRTRARACVYVCVSAYIPKKDFVASLRLKNAESAFRGSWTYFVNVACVSVDVFKLPHRC